MTEDPRVAPCKLRTIQQAVKLGTVLTGSWFRGHPCVYAQLTPAVFREALLTKFELPSPIKDPALVVEAHLVDGFRLKAPSVEQNLPPDKDCLSWLLLMQHHGTPTRLLDWTENVLVALYFAVRDEPQQDGELWAMAFTALAVAAGLPGIPAHDSNMVQYLAAQAMLNEPEHIAPLLGRHYSDENLYPLPIFPPLAFQRMMAQSSTFTIHPAPRAGNSIPELLTTQEQLVRYVIPAGCKKAFRDDLLALGINQMVLFPGLDGLSVYLQQETERPQVQRIQPPKWD